MDVTFSTTSKRSLLIPLKLHDEILEYVLKLLNNISSRIAVYKVRKIVSSSKSGCLPTKYAATDENNKSPIRTEVIEFLFLLYMK